MTTDLKTATQDFGEVVLSEDGRLPVPNALLRLFHLSGGDRVRFETDEDGRIVLSTRKRRRLVDIARANAFKIGELGRDIDTLIDEAVGEAMAEQDARARTESDG